MPRLSRNERILLRTSERKDMLIERYEQELQQGQQVDMDDILSLEHVHTARPDSGSSIIHSVFDTDRKPGDSRQSSRALPKDTHWFDTKVEFRNIKVPIRIPMTTFDEDVGEVSLRHFSPPIQADTSVLYSRACSDILQRGALSRAVPPSSPYERRQYPSSHGHPQRYARS